jgi:predicted amidohydrolase YtcJ
VTVDQAFHATCVAPSWLAGAERRRGTLLPGRDADLVVLDRDPWDDLDAQVVAAMVAGRWVHNPPPWD